MKNKQKHSSRKRMESRTKRYVKTGTRAAKRVQLKRRMLLSEANASQQTGGIVNEAV